MEEIDRDTERVRQQSSELYAQLEQEGDDERRWWKRAGMSKRLFYDFLRLTVLSVVLGGIVDKVMVLMGVDVYAYVVGEMLLAWRGFLGVTFHYEGQDR